jgi:large subunit ribosomal protein L13
MKTFSPKPRDIDRKWYVVDAQGAVLGRLAAHVATILRGKHKPIFAPHADTGDHVVVINARGVRVTGGKAESKMYYRHSGYPGGLRAMPFSTLMTRYPTRAVELAVKGMLPKNRLGREIFRKLSVYEGTEHPHGPQKPVPLHRGELPKWEGLPKVEPPAAAATPVTRRPSATARQAGETARAASTGRGRVTTRTQAKSTGRATPARTGARRTAGPAGEAKTSARRPAARRAAERVTARRTRKTEEKAEIRATGRGAKSTGAAGAKKTTAKSGSSKTRGTRRTKKES